MSAENYYDDLNQRLASEQTCLQQSEVDEEQAAAEDLLARQLELAAALSAEQKAWDLVKATERTHADACEHWEACCTRMYALLGGNGEPV